MTARYTCSDLQVRVLDQDPATAEAALVALTVQNTGDADGVTPVLLVVIDDAGAAREVASSEESLEVDHSHRVRHTLHGADLEGAVAVAAGTALDDLQVRYDLT